MPDLGHDEIASPFLEKLFPENFLETLDLTADRRLRQEELFARLDDAAFFGDRPEIEKMMIVYPFHEWIILPNIQRYKLNLPNCQIIYNGP